MLFTWTVAINPIATRTDPYRRVNYIPKAVVANTLYLDQTSRTGKSHNGSISAVRKVDELGTEWTERRRDGL